MRPAFYIDFTQQVNMPLPYIVCDRNSSAWGFVEGTLRHFGTDEARYTDAGLLVEREATNLIAESRDLDDGVVWSSSSMTITNAVGLDGGHGSLLEATSGNGTAETSKVAPATDNYTFSLYVKRVSGSGNISISMDNFATELVLVNIPTDGFIRYEIAQQFDITDTIRPTIKIETLGDEIIVDGCQLERGNYATSIILTTGTSLTRAADDIYMDVEQGNSISWFEDTEGTFIVKAIPTNKRESTRFIQIGDAALVGHNLRMVYQIDSSDKENYNCGYNNSFEYRIEDVAVEREPTGFIKIGTSYKDDEQLASCGGTTPAYPTTQQTEAIDFTTIDRLQFGCAVGDLGTLTSVTIVTLAYYTKYVTQETLNKMTNG
jgi:hypothetical protein